jgi:hypothetical protein
MIIIVHGNTQLFKAACSLGCNSISVRTKVLQCADTSEEETD